MVGMMLPSVTPMILIYAGVARQARRDGKPFASTGWFAGGYLLAWIGFSLAATSAQWGLERAALLTPMTVTARAARRRHADSRRPLPMDAVQGRPA